MVGKLQQSAKSSHYNSTVENLQQKKKKSLVQNFYKRQQTFKRFRPFKHLANNAAFYLLVERKPWVLAQVHKRAMDIAVETNTSRERHLFILVYILLHNV
jgi:hypothetical protein